MVDLDKKTMIKLDGKISAGEIESLYSKLKSNQEADLMLPKKIGQVSFGIVPSLIQFISVWHERTKNAKIILEVEAHEDLTHFYDIDYFFPSIVYCWDRDIVDVGNTDLKPQLKRHNERQYEVMKRQKAGGGNKMLLACFDHLSMEKGLLNAFYTDGLFISNELEFDFAIDNAIKNVLALNRELRNKNYRPVHFDVIAIIYELMKNTHDWARTDIYDKPLSPNVRGLFLKFHRQKRDVFSSIFEHHEGLKDYFGTENFISSNNTNDLYFLELSVFDTGIGFVQRYSKDTTTEYSSNQQVEIIKQCLLKNNTSAIGRDKEIKGQGLDRIMRILDNKGFFWLRTENVSVFRNLKKNRYVENGDTSSIQLFDYQSNSSEAFSRMEMTRGSTITLVYPLATTLE